MLFAKETESDRQSVCTLFATDTDQTALMCRLSSWYTVCHTKNHQGPVVQSIVSLTLRVISLTVLAESIHSILIFFAKKM